MGLAGGLGQLPAAPPLRPLSRVPPARPAPPHPLLQNGPGEEGEEELPPEDDNFYCTDVSLGRRTGRLSGYWVLGGGCWARSSDRCRVVPLCCPFAAPLLLPARACLPADPPCHPAILLTSVPQEYMDMEGRWRR